MALDDLRGLSRAGLACLGAAALGGALAADGSEVARRLAAGWSLDHKAERVETLPGLPPYESLGRDVQVTEYRLTRDGRTVICVLRYDSQRDHIEERCREPD